MDAEQNRIEFKFLLPKAIVDSVRGQIIEGFGNDLVMNDHYCICSDYFDTEDRTSYWEKLLGFTNRRRLRIRHYADSRSGRPPSSFIEIKHKIGDQALKRRVFASDSELKDFLRGKWPDFASRGCSWMARELENMMQPYPWEPLVRIRYERDEFDTGPEGTLRLTLDTSVCCCFPDYQSDADSVPDQELVGSGEAILEVKTIGPVPYWFRTLLGCFSLIPHGLSKYTTAIAKYDTISPSGAPAPVASLPTKPIQL